MGSHRYGLEISGSGQEEIYRCGWEGSEVIIDKTEHWYFY